MNPENTEEPESTAKTIENDKLKLIAEHAGNDLIQLIAEKEKELLEALYQVTEEAELQDKKPIFRIGYTISLDPDGDKMTTGLSFAVRRKLEIVRPMPDPAQPELPLSEAEVHSE
jgi:hypothetical protein